MKNHISIREQTTRSITILLILVVLVTSAVFVTPASAASLVVNSLLDTTAVDGKCTLREAITNAENNLATNVDCAAGSGADTITFSVNGTITLGSTLPGITDAAGLTIDGTGKSVTISGNHLVGVATVLGAPLTVNRLTIANGKSNAGGGMTNTGTLTITNSTFSGNAVTSQGGGILNYGILNVTNSTFSGNSATGQGGGIYNNIGTLTITNSTFSGNSANSGGGIANDAGVLTITKSTFSGNSADTSGGGGGGIWNNNSGLSLTIGNSTFSGNSAFGGGGIYTNDGTVTVANSTFASNSATNNGGGIYRSLGTATLFNTIVANSTAGGNCSAGITDGGNNLDTANTCGFTINAKINTNPNLGALTGSPAYFPLNSSSPAINAGNDVVCAAAPVNNESQNSVTRPSGANCDIGSYEVFQFAVFSPADGTAIHYNRPTFDWSDFPGATGYQLQVSKNNTFTQLVLSKTTLASTYLTTINLPANNTLLYWRVRAKVGLTYGAWSPVWTFTTANPPSAPTLVSPFNNALVAGLSPLFDWSNSTYSGGAVYYKIQIASDAAFTTIVHEHNIGGVTNSQDNDTILFAGTTYYWRVHSYNSVGDYSVWSAVRSVRIKFDAPVLSLPANGSTIGGLLPTFTWSTVVGATNYTLQVSKSSSFVGLVVNKTLTVPTFTATTNLSAGTTYYWRVKVNGPYGPSAWTVFSFKTP